MKDVDRVELWEYKYIGFTPLRILQTYILNPHKLKLGIKELMLKKMKNEEIIRKDEGEKILKELKEDLEIHITRIESEDYNMVIEFVLDLIQEKINLYNK
jgi:hypothetical protein